MVKNNGGKASYFFAAIVIMMGSFFLSGCWSSKEANDLAILNVLGIDKNDAGQYELSALMAKAQNPNYQSLGASERNQGLIQTGTGKTLLDAMSKLSESTSKRIYLGHVQAVIFGEKAARDSMSESLDFLKRENDFRPNIKMLVTKGKASDMIHTPTPFSSTLGAEILDSITNKRLSSTNMILNISHFSESSTKMKDPFTGVISLASNKGVQVEQTAAGTNSAGKPGNQNDAAISLQGAAVFKNQHLVGWLNKTETRGLLWINGKLKNDVLILKCPNKESGSVSMLIRRTTSQLSPQMINGKPLMNIAIKVDGDIAQLTCQNINLSPKDLAAINQQLNGTVNNEVKQTLSIVKQEWQADIFGFGKAIYRKYPQAWREISPTWKNGGLKDMPVHVYVTTNISRYGLRR